MLFSCVLHNGITLNGIPLWCAFTGIYPNIWLMMWFFITSHLYYILICMTRISDKWAVRCLIYNICHCGCLITPILFAIHSAVFPRYHGTVMYMQGTVMHSEGLLACPTFNLTDTVLFVRRQAQDLGHYLTESTVAWLICEIVL